MCLFNSICALPPGFTLILGRVRYTEFIMDLASFAAYLGSVHIRWLSVVCMRILVSNRKLEVINVINIQIEI